MEQNGTQDSKLELHSETTDMDKMLMQPISDMGYATLVTALSNIGHFYSNVSEGFIQAYP